VKPVTAFETQTKDNQNKEKSDKRKDKTDSLEDSLVNGNEKRILKPKENNNHLCNSLFGFPIVLTEILKSISKSR